MQIGDSVYIDVKINGINKEGFITPENLKSFILTETAGTSLPYLCFSFFTKGLDKSITEYFVENNNTEIEVSIGNTPEDSNKFNVQLVKTPKNTDGSDATTTIDGAGFIGNKSYMTDKGECRTYKGNSLMVAKQVLQRFEGLNNVVDSDFEKVNEKQMPWRQLYETANNFMVRTLLHMNVQPSFPLFSFDKFGNFHIKDYDKKVKEGVVATFTPFQPDKGEIKYLNNFNVDCFKPSYNLYSGYNKITEIYGIEAGVPAYSITDNIPLISSTNEAEKSKSGNRIALNKIQSANVHDTYEESYAYNTNRLVSLSSISGVLIVAGYHPELKPTDLVYVKTPKENGEVSSIEGNYLIDTIVLQYNFGDNIPRTYIYVTRDNNNNIENFVTNQESKNKNNLKLDRKFINDLANSVAKTRVALARCSQVIDGTLIESFRSYLTTTRNNLLRSFSIDGIIMDFTSQVRMLQSCLLVGNNLMNVLIELIFPEDIAYILKDFLIKDTSVKGLIGDYIAEYVPLGLREIISDLIDSLVSVNNSVNDIAKDNGITIREVPEVAQDNLIVEADDDNRVGEVFQEFENNTTGLDIPFPVIELTESQMLYPEEKLKDYLATETISNLADLGYLTYLSEEEIEELRDILLGNQPINFALINKINEAAGEKLNYRFWGTYGSTDQAMYAWKYKDNYVYTKTSSITVYTRLFNNDYSPYMEDKFRIIKNEQEAYEIVYVVDEETTEVAERDEKEDITSNALSQLTDYYINKGFKDRYRTIPCTKLISATKNARLYFACPQKEENIKFYINSKRVELKSFPIDLGYTDVYGNKIMYNVYYTETGYNSNSTMLEIRQ